MKYPIILSIFALVLILAVALTGCSPSPYGGACDRNAAPYWRDVEDWTCESVPMCTFPQGAWVGVSPVYYVVDGAAVYCPSNSDECNRLACSTCAMPTEDADALGCDGY